MITKLNELSLDEAFALIRSVTRKMDDEGIFQWDEIYPTREILRDDLRSGQAYGYHGNDALRGYIVLSEEYSPEYKSVRWNCAEGKSLVIHRLSVRPDCQGRGIAKRLMNHAEEHARNAGYLSIKLDAFVNNPAALKLYEGLNYSLAGTVRFRKGIFNCYEKVL
ncbi:MAG: GNAT family N-acetyltransferase [Spirochaetes bacterium]|nr:MAG: GNAT family N-acetyltransferase [Spirochaetota bacterium]